MTETRLTADPRAIASYGFTDFGPIELLIIQPTTFCNLDCDYCYLPDRQLKHRFSLDLLEPLFKNLFASPFFRQDLTVCWHAGEPLAVPVEFYQAALSQIQDLDRQFNSRQYPLRQSIQTNGTLITPAWCELFQQYEIAVGISLDGPEFIHDAHRKTRTGLGTHASTMRGINQLRQHNIDFRVIAVISQVSLDYPDEIFNFFMENGITDVGFNIEELEGVHRTSSLEQAGTSDRYRAFMQRVWDLIAQSGGEFKLREFERLGNLIYNNERIPRSGLTTPFVMLNVDYQGNFSTFDPELLAVKTDRYGDFILGNVRRDSFESVCQTEKFQRIYEDITAGVNLCRQTCQYFGVCGGGAASNKYWEHHTFRAAETMACRFYEQIPTDIIISELERSLGLG